MALALIAFSLMAAGEGPCRPAKLQNVIKDQDVTAPLVLVTTSGDRFRVYGNDFIDVRSWHASAQLKICSDPAGSQAVEIENVGRQESVVARSIK
jgi:hypothetical protein